MVTETRTRIERAHPDPLQIRIEKFERHEWDALGGERDSSGSAAGGVGQDPIWISYIEMPTPDAMRGIENLFEPVMASEVETVPPQFRSRSALIRLEERQHRRRHHLFQLREDVWKEDAKLAVLETVIEEHWKLQSLRSHQLQGTIGEQAAMNRRIRVISRMLNTSEKLLGWILTHRRDRRRRRMSSSCLHRRRSQGGKGARILERVAESVGGSAAREAVRDNLARGR